MEEKKVIETKQGKLRGLIRQSWFSDKRYYSFLGIPFAKPPVGNLRFKDPEPFGGWEGVRDAIVDGNKCKQGILVRNPGADPENIEDVGDEDCLYLCVHTNEQPEETPSKKPVMVYIHGGAFAGGSGTSKSANSDYLLEGDIVLVTVNYRCGAFGFLSLENEEVPGNAGLKDQTLALKWVQDNIESFGGDPNNVTIFGISAGGASVHYHLLSPLSKGLFHKAIIQSGFCVQNEWSLQRSPKKIALKLAKNLGCTSEHPQEVLQFLQNVPSEDIVIATHQFCKEEEYMTWTGVVFTACVEIEGPNQFLPDTPTHLMKRGEFSKVPTILGIVENEGIVHTFLAQTCFSFESLPQIINHKPELLVPPFLGLKPGSEEQKEAQKSIWNFYFKGEPLSLTNFREFIKYESDFLINAGLGGTRSCLLEHSPCPVYTYLFTNHSRCFCSDLPAMVGADNPVLQFLGPGTCHGADGIYLKKQSNMPKSAWTPDFEQSVLRHVKAWTNFASSGDPSVEELGVRWDQDSKMKPCYMDIGTVWTMREGVPFAGRMNFWEQLTDKYLRNMEQDLIVIQTKLGKLRGRIKNSTFSNKKYFSFVGVPFGKPPVGELRFKAPQPFGGWEGVRDALEDGNDPKQSVFFRRPDMDPDQVTQGSEDCLYLCVYTSELPEKSAVKKPVMINIHGGGFAGGSGNSKNAGPDYLLEGNVVLVSFNYRCGAFGFLSLENEEVPGNAGLKDQTLALKWVQDNIESFGGDPNNVTIFGISAGGASVHYHLLSPLSKDLFHKAIIQSGWAENPWAFQSSPKKIAIELSKKLGCTYEDPHEVLKFLQSVPSDDIVTTTKEMSKVKEHMMSCGLVFSPCVEVAGKDKFLPDTPKNLMKRGQYNKVPTIQGLCQNEGTVFLLFALVGGVNFEEIPTVINNNPEILVPTFLRLKSGSTEEKEAQKAIWDFYFEGEPLSLNNFSHYMEYQSDLLFNVGFGEARRYFLANSFSPHYSYLFTNCPSMSPFIFGSLNAVFNKFMTSQGTGHGADVPFLFTLSNGLPTPELTPDFREAISRHVRAWTTFALTGDPNTEDLEPIWDRDSKKRPCYMDIGASWDMKEGLLFADRMNFWEQLITKYCTS